MPALEGCRIGGAPRVADAIGLYRNKTGAVGFAGPLPPASGNADIATGTSRPVPSFAACRAVLLTGEVGLALEELPLALDGVLQLRAT